MTQSIVISTTEFDAVLDAVSELIKAVEADGLIPGEVLPDGVLRRCGTTDKPKSKNGWYVLHADPVAGAYGNWATGLSKSWSLPGEPLPPATRQRLKQDIERQKAERLKAEAETRATATAAARGYLDGLKPATDSNQYLKQKGVKAAAGLLVDGDVLVVPVLGEDDKPISYQRIDPTGDKRFCPGAPVAGGRFAINWNGGPLLICEGVATGLSLHEATGFTVLCAFSAGNLETVAKMARSQYPERQIILAADNDSKTEARTGKNPGVDEAKAAALAVNGLLAVPESGGDFNDLHQAKGLEGVKTGIDAARPVEMETVSTVDDWPEPMPLTPEEAPSPYPEADLPGVIGAAVAEEAGFVQCPLPLAACSCLAALSTVVGGLVDVRRAERLTGPSALFVLVLADSGERKTTVDNAFTAEIRAWQARQKELFKPALNDWRAADASWNAEKDGIVNAIRDAAKRGKDTGELKTRLADLEARKPERPRVPRLLWDDSTTEALTLGLANRWPVGGILSSEGGAVLGGHSMRAEGLMKTLAVFNGLWDGAPSNIDRKTSECFTIESARLTLGLALQPKVMRQFIDGTRGLARGSGFLARFLVAWPESTQGRRNFKEAPESRPAMERFHRRLAELLDYPLPIDETGVLRPNLLALDANAKKTWIHFHDEVEAELLPGGDMAETRDVASKAADNAARLAAIFHTFEHGPAGMIGRDHMERAGRIVTWHLFEAKRFLGQMATPEAVADAMALEIWLTEYCRREGLAAVPITEIQQKGPNRTRRKAALDGAITELEACERARRIKDGRRVFVRVNPAILKGC